MLQQERGRERVWQLAGKPYFQGAGWLLLAGGIGGLVAGIIGAQRVGDIVRSGMWTGIFAVLLGVSLVFSPRAYDGGGNFALLCILCVLLLASAVVSVYITGDTYGILANQYACAEETSNPNDSCLGYNYYKCYGDEEYFDNAMSCVGEASSAGHYDECICYSMVEPQCRHFPHADSCHAVMYSAERDFQIAIVFYAFVGIVAIVLLFLLFANCCCPRCLRTPSEEVELQHMVVPTFVTTRI